MLTQTNFKVGDRSLNTSSRLYISLVFQWWLSYKLVFYPKHLPTPEYIHPGGQIQMVNESTATKWMSFPSLLIIHTIICEWISEKGQLRTKRQNLTIFYLLKHEDTKCLRLQSWFIGTSTNKEFTSLQKHVDLVLYTLMWINDTVCTSPIMYRVRISYIPWLTNSIPENKVSH